MLCALSRSIAGRSRLSRCADGRDTQAPHPESMTLHHVPGQALASPQAATGMTLHHACRAWGTIIRSIETFITFRGRARPIPFFNFGGTQNDYAIAQDRFADASVQLFADNSRRDFSPFALVIGGNPLRPLPNLRFRAFFSG